MWCHGAHENWQLLTAEGFDVPFRKVPSWEAYAQRSLNKERFSRPTIDSIIKVSSIWVTKTSEHLQKVSHLQDLCWGGQSNNTALRHTNKLGRFYGVIHLLTLFVICSVFEEAIIFSHQLSFFSDLPSEREWPPKFPLIRILSQKSEGFKS